MTIMTILDQIKQDTIAARKAKNALKSALLTTLVSEVVNVGKNDGNRETTDAETVAVVKKFLKGVDETINAIKDVSNVDGSADRYVNALHEQEILRRYLPAQLTEQELAAVVAQFVSTLTERNPKQMGAVMAFLKVNYDGQYDGKSASAVVKQALQ